MKSKNPPIELCWAGCYSSRRTGPLAAFVLSGLVTFLRQAVAYLGGSQSECQPSHIAVVGFSPRLARGIKDDIGAESALRCHATYSRLVQRVLNEHAEQAADGGSRDVLQ